MTEGEALFRAVVESPADDAVRQVYADWLEEYGEPERAEFIRVQVERPCLAVDDRRQEALKARQAKVAARMDEWRGRLPCLGGINWQRFWRGFVSGADVMLWKFYRDQADTLFAVAPIQFLRFLSLAPAECQELAASVYLRRLWGLTLSRTKIGDDGVRALAECPHLSELRNLSICGGGTHPRFTCVR